MICLWSSTDSWPWTFELDAVSGFGLMFTADADTDVADVEENDRGAGFTVSEFPDTTALPRHVSEILPQHQLQNLLCSFIVF